MNKSENPAIAYTIIVLVKLKTQLIIRQTNNLCSCEKQEESCQFDGLYIHIA